MYKYLFVLCLVVLAGVAYAELPQVTVSKIDPQPVEPGQDLTVQVNFYNSLNNEIGPFDIFMDVNYPFTVKSSSEKTTGIRLCRGCTYATTYFLSIAPSVQSGIYPVFVGAADSGSNIKQKIDVDIKGTPNIAITAGGSLDELIPNLRFSLPLTMKNIGTGTARQIKVEVSTENFIVLGSSITNLDEINSSSSREINFDFIVSSGIEAGAYNIPFKITYIDDNGETTTTTQNIGVRVVNKGDLNINNIKIISDTGSSTPTAGKPFSVVIRVENVGKGDANGIITEMKCPFDAAKKSFLGQLKKDEDAPAVFDMKAPGTGNYQCDVLISFNDDMGDHNVTQMFDIKVASGDSYILLITIVIIIIVFILYKKGVIKFKNNKS